LMQFQADILQCQVHLPVCLETTALGAAYFAGLACGFYDSKRDIESNHGIRKRFQPRMSKEEAEERYDGWLCAIAAARAFKPKKKA
ncbi:MAG: FGGY-family carbohydrate kinase, partial [Candidatus Enteromonas sp.]|nr:FGGY-family carbohydrate kinase [Candidatus Enteromonas sp.]